MLARVHEEFTHHRGLGTAKVAHLPTDIAPTVHKVGLGVWLVAATFIPARTCITQWPMFPTIAGAQWSIRVKGMRQIFFVWGASSESFKTKGKIWALLMPPWCMQPMRDPSAHTICVNPSYIFKPKKEAWERLDLYPRRLAHEKLQGSKCHRQSFKQ